MNPVSDKTPDILVVDDTPANLQLISGMLRLHGYKVRPVASATLALQAAKTSRLILFSSISTCPSSTGIKFASG